VFINKLNTVGNLCTERSYQAVTIRLLLIFLLFGESGLQYVHRWASPVSLFSPFRPLNPLSPFAKGLLPLVSSSTNGQTKNFSFYNEQTGFRFPSDVSMSPCLHVSTSPRLHASVSPYLHLSMSPCVHVSLSPCFHGHVSTFPEFRKRKMELMENGNRRLFAVI
jgi:hypothetical protein